MNAGRNKTRLVGWHPSAGLVAWLDAEIERRGGGRGVQSAILEEALASYMAGKRDTGTRQRPSRASRAAEPEESSSASPGAGEPGQETARKPRAKLPCEHRVQPGSYCARCKKLI